MATKREQILQAMRTALVGTVGVGTRIYRSRPDPVSRGETPAIIIEPAKDVPEQNTSLPTLDWSFVVRVIVLSRAAIADLAADATIESLHAKLVADLTLGGLAIDVQPGPVTFEFVEADSPAAVIVCEYVVRYRTSVASLSS